MRQTLFTFLLAFLFIVACSVLELEMEGRADDIVYGLLVGSPQLIIPLIIVTLIFHVLVLKNQIKIFNNFTTKLIIGLALSLFAILVIWLVDKFPPKSDLIFLLGFFMSISVSYYIMERQLSKSKKVSNL